MTTFSVGEVVDISIRGARVVNTYPEHHSGVQVANTLVVKYGADSTRSLAVNTLNPEVTVTRVAPKEWPPQPGDVWRNEHGVKLFATEPFEGQTDLRSTRGDVFEKPETALEHLGPLKLVYREGWSPEPAPASEVAWGDAAGGQLHVEVRASRYGDRILDEWVSPRSVREAVDLLVTWRILPPEFHSLLRDRAPAGAGVS